VEFGEGVLMHLPTKLHFNFLDENSDGCDTYKAIDTLKTLEDVRKAGYRLVDDGLKQYSKVTEARRRRRAEIEKNQGVTFK